MAIYRAVAAAPPLVPGAVRGRDVVDLRSADHWPENARDGGGRGGLHDKAVVFAIGLAGSAAFRRASWRAAVLQRANGRARAHGAGARRGSGAGVDAGTLRPDGQGRGAALVGPDRH